jgi:hypothetical protein
LRQFDHGLDGMGIANVGIHSAITHDIRAHCPRL